jgi:hypothetical protein
VARALQTRRRNMEKTIVRAGVACAALALGLVSGVRDAAACGGCFHPSAEQGSSVITDHRMVLKVSTTETILWDQVRYSGSPSEFAWVLPVRAGATVELSHDEWIAALDAATQTTVRGPEIFCNTAPTTSTSSSSSSSSSSGSSSGGSSSSGGGGCGGGSTTTAYVDTPRGNGSPDVPPPPPPAGPGFAGNEEVEVVAQSVIGPYQAVTIHSNDGGGVAKWLSDNGFAIPDPVKPIVDAYTNDGFDFIALRLKPDASVRAMRPVRVVTPGANLVLPLRMVAAGVGAHVGLTLWVVGEGRYHTQNFPDAPLDWSALRWNSNEDRSNLKELTATALASNKGWSWLSEAALPADVVTRTRNGPNPSLFDAYESQCEYLPLRNIPCDPTALPSADGGTEDAGADADADAGHTECVKEVRGCDGYDDLDVAKRGLHASDVWVTRLRADLPVAALSADLKIEAAADQKTLSPAHTTTTFTDPSFDPCSRFGSTSAPKTSTPPPSYADDSGCTCRTAPLQEDAGTAFVIALGAIGASIVTRRRRR